MRTIIKSNMFHPDAFIVGKKVSKPNAPQGVFLDLTGAGLLLVIRLPNISDATVRDIRNGVAQFRVGMINEVIIFFARFGMQPWYNANFHRGFAEIPELPLPPGFRGYPIHVLLVDSGTGVLRAKKSFELSRSLSSKFNELIMQQDTDAPMNWDITVKRAYRRRSVNQMVAFLGLED